MDLSKSVINGPIISLLSPMHLTRNLPRKGLLRGVSSVVSGSTEVSSSFYNGVEWEDTVNRALGKVHAELTPAQSAYRHRLGLQRIPPLAFCQSLSHPLLRGSRIDNQIFKKRLCGGNELLNLFTHDYVSARFPKLPSDSFNLALKVYQNSRNLALSAKATGIEYAIINFKGLPRISLPSVQEYIASLHGVSIEKDSETEESSSSSTFNQTLFKPSEFYADIFKAILGTIHCELGPTSVRRFLDSYHFTGHFDTDLLCRPRNPMLKLSFAFRNLRMSSPEYRLLHETGRLSTAPVYVVGVYSRVEKVAEAHGPSMLVAQERAAVEALKRLFVVDIPDAVRKSDFLLHQDESSFPKELKWLRHKLGQ